MAVLVGSLRVTTWYVFEIISNTVISSLYKLIDLKVLCLFNSTVWTINVAPTKKISHIAQILRVLWCTITAARITFSLGFEKGSHSGIEFALDSITLSWTWSLSLTYPIVLSIHSSPPASHNPRPRKLHWSDKAVFETKVYKGKFSYSWFLVFRNVDDDSPLIQFASHCVFFWMYLHGLLAR